MQLRTPLPQFGRLAALLSLLCLAPSVHAQQTGPGLVVTYVEAPAAKGAVLAADLQTYARQIEGGPGKPSVTVLTEFDRPNRMVVLEQWADLSSPDFAGAATLLAARVEPDTLAPIDRRVNHPLTPALTQPASTAFIVLMHIDIGGPEAGAGPKIVQAQRDAVLAAPGALGYQAATQDHHQNHFTICEIWKSRASYEAYITTKPAQDFRRQLAPIIGSPFDDRLYTRTGR